MALNRSQQLRAVGVLLLLITACSLSSSQREGNVRGPAGEGLPEPGRVLWEADHETGDLSQWTWRQGEAVFNTGTGYVYVTHEVASRSGRHSLVLGIYDAFGGMRQAARIFRWAEDAESAYYSAWYYFPKSYHSANWWNIMQFKSPDESGRPEPTWVVNVHGRRDGHMRLYLWDALNEVAYHNQLPGRSMRIPIGEWVHIELYARRSVNEDGRIALWQDGVLLFDLEDVQTAITDSIQWSIDNYTDAIDPTEVIIYVDDAIIREGEW